MTSPTIDTGTIVDDLAYAYDRVFARSEIEQAVLEARSLLETGASVHTFLPVLVARHARETLLARAQADGRVAKKVPELLFVCVHNAGRSQLAAALADHLSGHRVHVRSAGSQPTGEVNPLVVQVLAERGVALSHAYPKPLSDTVVKAADVIVTMGCGDSCPYFPGKRYEDWTVDDPAGQPIETLRRIRDEIAHRVTDLLGEILD